MSKVRVLAFAFTSNPDQWARFRNSAARCNIPTTVNGNGRPFPDDRIWWELTDMIDRTEEPYVLYTCTYDTFVARWSEDEIVDIIERGNGLIVGTESDCWPSGPWSSAYQPGDRGINGGEFCGTKERVKNLILGFRDRLNEVVAGGGNQELLHRMYADGYPMVLDQKCEIYQSMSGRSSGEVKWNGSAIENSVTGSRPMLMHFNGRTPGIEEWYGRVYGNKD